MNTLIFIPMKFFTTAAGMLLIASRIFSQDTFSIVAVDTITGEVGSAGASCVDLFAVGFLQDDFLGELFPGVGAINTQSYYLTSNQATARNRMNAGDTPQQIIDYLIANDAEGNPSTRQYGVVRLIGTSSQSAAYTGVSCMDYKNHITGRNYSIQGNILLNATVLEAMEDGFNNTEGDLRCKLMGALQGANIVGADSRCSSNGTSSLFAFIKVAQPTDAFNTPSFKLSVRTHDNAGIEPIDSLQTLFDQVVPTCGPLGLEEMAQGRFQVFPNPAGEYFTIQSSESEISHFELFDQYGRKVLGGAFREQQKIDTESLSAGIYTLQISFSNHAETLKLTIRH